MVGSVDGDGDERVVVFVVEEAADHLLRTDIQNGPLPRVCGRKAEKWQKWVGQGQGRWQDGRMAEWQNGRMWEMGKGLMLILFCLG